MMTENMTVTEEMRDEMFKYAVEVINEDSYSQNNWTNLHEEDSFYNWYNGYTKIKSPYYDYNDNALNINIETAATSGVVNTKHYGDQFRPELVERKLYYRVDVFPPESVRSNENVTLHFKLEKLSMTELASSSFDRVSIGPTFGITVLDADETITYKNFTPPCTGISSLSCQWISLSRDVNSEDVETQKLEIMPGFIFRWWYSGRWVTPDNKYKEKEMTKQFVR